MTPEFDLALRGSQARIRTRAPFFATLALFAQFTTGSHHATDGYIIQLEPHSFVALPREARDATLLHLLLHAALQHSARCGVRDKKLWSVAADIIVAGIIAKQGGFVIPADWPRNERLEDLNVEEVYAVLAQQNNEQQQQQQQQPQPALENDLLEPPKPQPNSAKSDQSDSPEPAKSPGKSDDAGKPDQSSDSPNKNGGKQPQQSAPEKGDAQEGNAETGDAENGEANNSSQGQGQSRDASDQPNGSSNPSNNGDPSEGVDTQGDSGEAAQGNQFETRPRDLKTYWRNALSNAITIEKQSKNRGQHALGASRELAGMLNPQISWRDALARLVCRRPVDFEGFDRRFFSRGLYLESLEGISVYVDICIDTSGSISDSVMALMLGEVAGILVSYPGVKATISYADARLYGPYEFEGWEELEKPRGGGGTSFKPFFKHLETLDDIGSGERVAIYLTDGYGSFPDLEPDYEVVWVVIPGGAGDETFPFGEVIRMVD